MVTHKSEDVSHSIPVYLPPLVSPIPTAHPLKHAYLTFTSRHWCHTQKSWSWCFCVWSVWMVDMKVHERRSSHNVLLVGPWQSNLTSWVLLRQKGVSVEWVGLFSSCWTDSLCEDGETLPQQSVLHWWSERTNCLRSDEDDTSLSLVWGCQLWSSFISCSHENNNLSSSRQLNQMITSSFWLVWLADCSLSVFLSNPDVCPHCPLTASLRTHWEPELLKTLSTCPGDWLWGSSST